MKKRYAMAMALCLLPSISRADDVQVRVTPCRLYDSRMIGGYNAGAKITSGTILVTDPSLGTQDYASGGVSYNAQGGQTGCSVPAGATGVYVNLTVVGPTGPGFARLWATGQPEPLPTAVTFASGQTDEATGLLVRLGVDGNISAHVVYASSHVVLDISGYTKESCMCDDEANAETAQTEESEMLISSRTLAPSETRAKLMGDRGTVTVATEHTGYPGTKLLRDNLADYWRAWSQRASHTWIEWTSDISSLDRVISAVAVLGINRVSPTTLTMPISENRWRLRVSQWPLSDRVRPAVTAVSLTNLTGTVADISGPVDPPQPPTPSGYTSSRLASINPAFPTAVLVTFANHHATELALSGGQWLRVHLADSVTPSTIPSASAVADPTTGTDFGLSLVGREKTAEGWIFSFSWSASQLTDPSATLRFMITGASTGSSTVEILGVEWLAELAAPLYDSGALLLTNALSAEGESVRDLPETAIPAGSRRYVLAEFSDFSEVEVIGSIDRILTDVGGQFHAGRLVICETFELATTNDGWLYAPQSNGDAQPMRDGSERFPSTVMSWDEYEIKAESRTESQAVDDLLLGLYRAVDVRFPFLVIPHEDEPSHDRWVRFVPNTFELSGGGVKAGKEGMGRRWNFEARVKEHTARAGVRG